ncbi:signal peptide peptidase SppA [Vibrio nitrifigilis]|uniref:Signal peptide peptidase SppA n=1 Tax=Vibrio nitrifigilis TaxID=2789781 RepID=A0ABS0GBX6_9VIBR|nr:signal peptide peptidase SppA [Vibrio nitrifigilis]MBF8999906.1 signal peptide peptidase SppA [Vibrio nitrifigilis]
MKKIVHIIGLIFKGIWKTITFIRIALLNVIFLAFIAVLYFAYTQSIDSTPKEATTPSALVLNLSGPIVEQSTYSNPVDSITGSVLGEDLPKENVLFKLVDTIRYAKTDPNVTGLVLSLKNLPETNLTKLRYIAKAINEFKASGKPVFAVGDYYNQSQYYLASYADKIFLSPDGGVMLKGYSAYSMYFKKLLDKLDVNTHIFRVGTYKSAVEPFMRDDMSKAAKEASSRWLGQLWGAYIDDVATNRHIEVKTLTPDMQQFLAMFKKANGNLAQLSLNAGLVDELATRPKIRAELTRKFGSDGIDSYNAISYYDYQSQVPSKPHHSKNDIAVIVASGAIMDGTQPRGRVGGDTLAAQLRDARNDDQVKAVVLRVDSPGGSAFASEVIREEIDALKAAGKPVVVSMSSLAASGGYWISMSADKIIAQPTTLTGSIGIFSVITTFEKGLSKLGVSTDGVGTTPFSGLGVTTGLSDGAKQALQMGIEHGYQRFISLVGKNRHMTLDQVDDIAQGRVWTGQDALKIGLVDQLGDFDDAVTVAAKLANLQSYDLDWIAEPLTPAQQLLQDVLSEAHTSLGLNLSSMVPAALQPAAKQLTESASLLNSFNDPKGVYAFCLNCQVE